jgi:mono/diheme cytochrome c family protein
MYSMIRSSILFLSVAVLVLFTSGLLFSAEGTGAKQEEWKAPARAAKKPNPIPADENSIAAGKIVYIKECLSCHGTTGKGDGPAAKALDKKPGDLSNPKMWEQTDGALFWKITTGNKPMASFEKLLTEEQRWNVINYVRTLAPHPSENK